MDCCKTKSEKGCCSDLKKQNMEEKNETTDNSRSTKKIWIFGAGFIFMLVLGIFLLKPVSVGYLALNDYDQPVQFYKSITCGCCDAYAKYFESKTDINLEISTQTDISDIKAKYGIPAEMQSCHTAVIGTYFVEGHMPLEAIDKLLSEKPNIKGIALPGMPSGSPGMPGQKYGEFVIYSINNDGTISEFMKI